jgi:hypothetical protein
MQLTKAKVAEICQKQKEISKKGLSAQYDNSVSAWSFYNSDQSSYSDRIQYLDTYMRRKRSLVTFNKIQQNVDSVVGFMAQNRRQAKFVARLPNNQGQQLYSKNMNALYNYMRENTNSDQLETEQDLDMMVCGYGAIDADVSYTIGNATKMPNGEIVKKKLSTDCVYWDPRAKQKNLMDKRWCGYYEDYELEDALDLFQDSKTEDFEQVADDSPEESNYVFNPYGGIYSKIRLDDSVEWTSKDQNMVRVYNHQWMEYETFYKAANPLYAEQDPLKAMFIQMKLDLIASEQKQVGDSLGRDLFELDPRAEVLVFDESIKARLVKELNVEPIAYKRKTFYWAVVSGSHVFSWGKCISQQDFSIKFKTGTYNHNKKIWVGMVNPMMEPQEYYNKALTEQLFAIASNSKGGVIIEENSTEDIADFEAKYAKTDGVVVVKDGAVSGGTIMPKAQPQMNTGITEILGLAEQNISQNGVDPAFMGDVTRADTSGVLYKRMVRQIISKFSMYVDSITLYQKEDARLHGDLIPLWVENNLGALARITGEDGMEDFVELTQDMLAPEYDVDIQEAPQSVDEKMETAQMLNSNALNLLTAQQVGPGLMFMKEALQFTRLDGDVRMRLSEALQPQEDPRIAMMQQQLQAMQEMIQSGMVEKTKSETEYNMARAMKTMKDADVSTVNVPKVQAETIKIMEEAGRTAVESNAAMQAPVQDTQVNV